MKTIVKDLSFQRDVFILPLADLHIGDAGCNMKLIKDVINRIRTTPNMYTVLAGDILDSAIASSVGDTYGAKHQPQSQFKLAIDLFKPLAEAGKILAIIGGNHENRIYKQTGIDIVELFAMQLGLEDIYSPTTSLLFVKVGRRKRGNPKGGNRPMVYSLYITHGSGGGKKIGGKANRLESLSDLGDFDVYICGHTHAPMTFKECFIRTNYQTYTTTEVTHTFVNTASALNWGGYGEVQGFRPPSNEYPIIKLHGDNIMQKKTTVFS